MKFATATGIAVAAAIAGAAVFYGDNANTELFLVEPEVEKEFMNWLAKHGKNYGTKEEYQFRLNVFAKKMSFIEKFHEENSEGHDLELNHMADFTHAEYKRLLGFGVEKKALGGDGHDFRHHGRHHRGGKHQRNLSTVADAVNWVDQGAVTPVKNQGQCGSCWSFSATGSMEGRYQIKNGSLVSLSEQQLVDCSKAQGNLGCNGGLMDAAFTYAEATPLETEAQYPYTGTDGSCHAKGGSVAPTSFTDVPAKSAADLKAAAAEGPVSIAIDAAGIGFQLYHGGIMKGGGLFGCGTSLDHGVLLVGYGTDAGKDYWLVKNSWGASWGEKGYFRLARDDSSKDAGTCGLQLQASYPEF